MKTTTGGPAFPVECHWNGVELSGKQTGSNVGWEMGLSIRDWFAAQALTGIIAFPIPGQEKIPENAARDAYMFADAMLKARSQ